MLNGTIKGAVLLFTCSNFQTKLICSMKENKVGAGNNYASDYYYFNNIFFSERIY